MGQLSHKDIIIGTGVTIPTVSDRCMDIYDGVTDIAGESELKYFMSFGHDFL